MGYENGQGAGGEAGSVVTGRVTAHMITLPALLFLSFYLCSPLGCVLDEVNTLVPLAFEINLIRDLSPQTLRCSSVTGPRGVLLLHLLPFKH